MSLLVSKSSLACFQTEQNIKTKRDKSSGKRDLPKGKESVSTPEKNWQTNKCNLSLTDTKTLAGTEWLAFVHDVEKGEYAESKYRMKFYDEGGDLALRYNASSPHEMYDYKCEYNQSKNALECLSAPDPSAVCLSLMAGNATCTKEKILDFYKGHSDREIAEGIKKAEAFYQKLKSHDEEVLFKRRYNNYANKLMGKVTVKIDNKRCHLSVSDQYRTIFNGKALDEYNVMGTNGFVPNKKGELLWEHCNDFRLFDLPNADYPKDWRQTVTTWRHKAKAPVYYLYLNADYMKAEEGCSDEFDVWLNGRPLQKGLKPDIVKVTDKSKKTASELRWKFNHTFPQPMATQQVVTMVIERKCSDKTMEKVVTCNAVKIE